MTIWEADFKKEIFILRVVILTDLGATGGSEVAALMGT